MSKKDKRCWYCGKLRPSRKPGDWWTFMGWVGPKGKKKLYVLYGCGEHHEGMEEAWDAYCWDGWLPQHERVGRHE